MLPYQFHSRVKMGAGIAQSVSEVARLRSG